MQKLKINFFSSPEDTEHSRELERALERFGSVQTMRNGGISQFELTTETDIEELRRQLERIGFTSENTTINTLLEEDCHESEFAE